MLVIDLILPESPRYVSIATLGPAGTSSEAAASMLFTHLCHDPQERAAPIQLHETYERAGQAVLDGRADLLLVANAYADIAQFYMNPLLSLAGAFVHDTPEYGIAARPDMSLPNRVRVATHPAPIPLIAQLMPKYLTVHDVIAVSSTSIAASVVRTKEVDVALTTAPAALLHGLKFISQSRTIRMLWSVFRQQHLGGTQGVAASTSGQANVSDARRHRVE